MEEQLRLLQQDMIRMQGEMQTTRQELALRQGCWRSHVSPLVERKDWGTFATVTRTNSGAFDPRLCTEMEAPALAAGAVLKAGMQPDSNTDRKRCSASSSC